MSHESCQIAWVNLFISSNGDVRICPNMDAIGNVKNQDIEDIWNNPKAQSIRDKIDKCTRSCKILNCNFNE